MLRPKITIGNNGLERIIRSAELKLSLGTEPGQKWFKEDSDTARALKLQIGWWLSRGFAEKRSVTSTGAEGTERMKTLEILIGFYNFL